MKNVLTFFTLLIFCGVQAQTGRDVSKEDQLNKARSKTFSIINLIPTGFLKPDLSTVMLLKNSGSIVRSSADKIETAGKSLFKYSMIMNVDVESLNNINLYSFIDQWFGTPYRLGGNTKKGIDCSSFTSSLFENIYAFVLPKQAKQQYAATKRISKAELKEGDLVFFDTRGGVSHVGVFLANGNFVHSSSSQGVTISNLSEPYYAKRFIGAGRLISKS